MALADPAVGSPGQVIGRFAIRRKLAATPMADDANVAAGVLLARLVALLFLSEHHDEFGHCASKGGSRARRIHRTGSS